MSDLLTNQIYCISAERFMMNQWGLGMLCALVLILLGTTIYLIFTRKP